MTKICFTLQGYRLLYCSMLYYLNLEKMEVKNLLYLLNTANLDSYSEANPTQTIFESSRKVFFDRLDAQTTPYSTEIQLYRSLECLKNNIDKKCLTSEQLEALMRLSCIIENMCYEFYKTFGFEIYD